MFNLNRYKTAQQRGQLPPSSLPNDVEKLLNRIRNQYRTHGTPGDGEGDKLNNAGSIGIDGGPPDIASPGFGSNERNGYPSGVSQYEDPGDKPSELPKDTDPDKPFTEDTEGDHSQYGEGLNTDVGMPNADPGDPLSMTDTALRKTEEGGDLDRKTDISNMSTRPRNDPRSRLTYNRARQNPMEFVRNRTR